MGTVKSKEVQKTDVVRLESEINNLWRELNTSNIPHPLRMELEGKLSTCEKDFKAVLGGQGSFKELEKTLNTIDQTLALAAIQQAENEIPKAAHTEAAFQGLENVRRDLKEGKLTPSKARHEVKDIMRRHS